MNGVEILSQEIIYNPMTRLDRVLRLLEDYDDVAAMLLNGVCDRQWCQKMLTYLRSEKEQLTQELIEHGCRRKN
jgi:hypothetical protein